MELKELSALDLDFDIELTGFETAEIDLMIAKLDERGGQKETDTAADACPAIERHAPPVACAGDLWRLSEHVLAVGDARDETLLARLMQGANAAAVITDPPYNIPIAGFASGKGRARHGDFAMAAGEMSPAEFEAFLRRCLAMIAHMIAGGFVSLFMDWRHIAQLVIAGESLGLKLRNICVWVKPRGGMGSLYRSQHELIAVFSTGKAAARNNIQLGRFGRNRTNVWHYAGPNPLRPDGRADLDTHPTIKPAAMIADAILDMTARGDIVLDPFAGVGTLLIAAEKTGRRARGIEIDPHYADACIRRWQDYTGGKAVLAETGETFDAIRERREDGSADGLTETDRHGRRASGRRR